jgi:hypothetical protein
MGGELCLHTGMVPDAGLGQDHEEGLVFGLALAGAIFDHLYAEWCCRA